jgi:hypothetical protein
MKVEYEGFFLIGVSHLGESHLRKVLIPLSDFYDAIL